MRKLAYIFIIVCLLGISFSGFGQNKSAIMNSLKNKTMMSLLISNSEHEDIALNKFKKTLDDLRSNKSRYTSEKKFLKHVYKYTHKKVLKNYKQYITLDETLSSSGNYDCLTGTLLYGLLIDELGYSYTVREFNYHVLLVVHLEDEDVLIESTDPLNGFVDGAASIELRISSYKKEDISTDNRSGKFVFTTVMDNSISLLELTGLHYYNRAIYHLNKEEFAIASLKINRAYALYPSQRIKEVNLLINGGNADTFLVAGK